MHTRMDFRPNRAPRSSRKAKRNPLPFVLAGAMLLGVLAYHTHVANQVTRLKQETAQYQQEGLQYAGITAKFDALQNREARLQKTLSLAESLTTDTVSFSQQVKDLVPLLPTAGASPEVFMRSLTIIEGNDQPLDNATAHPGDTQLTLTLQGAAKTPRAVAKLVKTFEQSPHYDAQLQSVNQAGNGDYSFNLRLVSILPGPAASAPSTPTSAATSGANSGGQQP